MKLLNRFGKYMISLLIVLVVLVIPSFVDVEASSYADVDVTTSNVRDDLVSMNKDKLSYLFFIIYFNIYKSVLK